MSSGRKGARPTVRGIASALLVAGCAGRPVRPDPAPLPPARAQATPAVTPAAPPPPPKPTVDQRFALGIRAFQQGDWKAAHEQFQRLAEEDPSDAAARFDLGLTEERQGRGEQAEQDYLEALRPRPSYGPALLGLARLYRRSGRLPSAQALYGKAVAAAGDAPAPALLDELAEVDRLLGRREEAEALVRRVLARHNDDPEAYRTLALLTLDEGQLRLAELLANTALKLAPDDPASHNTMGMIALKLEERPRALAEFERAIQLDPRYAPAQMNLGTLALSFRDYARAERAFAAALEADPSRPEARRELAWALDGQKGQDPKKGAAAGAQFERLADVCDAGWAYAADPASWSRARELLGRCAHLGTTSPQIQRAIEQKLAALHGPVGAEPAPTSVGGSGAAGIPATSGPLQGAAGK